MRNAAPDSVFKVSPTKDQADRLKTVTELARRLSHGKGDQLTVGDVLLAGVAVRSSSNANTLGLRHIMPEHAIGQVSHIPDTVVEAGMLYGSGARMIFAGSLPNGALLAGRAVALETAEYTNGASNTKRRWLAGTLAGAQVVQDVYGPRETAIMDADAHGIPKVALYGRLMLVESAGDAVALEGYFPTRASLGLPNLGTAHDALLNSLRTRAAEHFSTVGTEDIIPGATPVAGAPFALRAGV